MINNQMNVTAASLPKPVARREYSLKEKLLLLVALAIGIVCDRLIFNGKGQRAYVVDYSAFWLVYLVLFYTFYWERLWRSPVLWYVGACSALLCVWNFIYPQMPDRQDANSAYREWTIFVIPFVLMAHAQYAAGEYKLKQAGKLAVAWLLGWVLKPFKGIGMFFGAIYGSISGRRGGTVGKILIAIAILIPVTAILIALLSGADLMFGYHIQRILHEFDFVYVIHHTLIVFIVFMFCYSFLWNIGYGKRESQTISKELKIDTIISSVILGAIIALYTSFFAVQFTYLFARANLPTDMLSFAEYAREGFGQTVAICAINLVVFGVFLQGSFNKKHIRVLLVALLGVTVLMLFSGMLRLKLYVDAYGLTWLRLLSAWFIVYLAAVIVICVVRMLRSSIPAVAIAAIILIGWFLILGFANPGRMIEHYNIAIGWA